MRLKNKRVLVTGGAKRLGRVISLLVAKEGGSLIIHHNNSSNEAELLKNEIQTIGQNASVYQADFTDFESRNTFLENVFSKYVIDIVINNASIFSNLDWNSTTIEDWRAHQTVNLETPFLISQYFARRMAAGNKGKIINMLDWRALRPGADHFPYTISKAGLAALTKSLAISLAPDITVNGIALGAILPPTDGSAVENITDYLPIPRWAKIDELEEIMLFLMSAPNYITGEIIHFDGGRHLN